MTPRNLRDAHASWLLAGGADIYIVRDRLGHSSITTTEIYLGRLTGRDDVAIKALETFRQQGSPKPSATPPPETEVDLDALRRLATQLNQILTPD